MEESYAEWKTDRDLKVAYLKIHPPTPMAWIPLPKSNDGKRAAWEEVREEVMEGGVVEAGKRVAERLLISSPRWKPMYGSLIMEDISTSWMSKRFEEMTSEESDRFVEKLKNGMELRWERSRKQKELQERLKSEKSQAQDVKDEL